MTVITQCNLTKLILNHIPPLTLTSKKIQLHNLFNNEKKSIYFERLIILPPKLTFQTYFHDSPSSFTNSSSFFTRRMFVNILFTHMHSDYKSNFLYSEKGHSFPLLSCCQFSWLCDFKIFVLPISFQTCFTMLGNMADH